MKRAGTTGVLVFLLSAGVGSLAGETTGDAARLRANLEDEAADFWIYDDLEAAYARARKSGKPLLVSFRCVP